MNDRDFLEPESVAVQDQRSLAHDNNDFAIALYERLRQRPGDLIFSPFSIRVAVSMASAGARGDTAAQMRDALYCSSSDESLHAGIADIVHRLNAAGGGKLTLAAANSLWGQEGAPLQPEFVDQIGRNYGSCLQLVDFRRAAQKARAAINEWVEEKTNRRICDLIPPDGLDAETRLVLVNAVYFKGLWVVPFEKRATRDEPFHLLDGREVRVPLMCQSDQMLYLHGTGYQAVELIYQGDELSMLLILPDRKDGLTDLEESLSAPMLNDCVAKMTSREVELYLPRFKNTWGTENLKDLFVSLGMTLAFERFHADFSGINGCLPPHEEAMFIAAIFHKAFVEVNEMGTEAAAATAVGLERCGASSPRRPPQVPIFRADHPFLFAIRDRRSGVVLFLGRVTDPARER
jgi:serpin B